MKTLQLRDAKATLSALVEAAERGEATVVTKHGRPAAMIVPIEVGQRIYRTVEPSFASLLMGLPDDLATERDELGPREVDF
ncbi:MAG: type II toxin-antitoxin system prevent-host-death family antitoxin [Acetobacteraceae bacterium]